MRQDAPPSLTHNGSCFVAQCYSNTEGLMLLKVAREVQKNHIFPVVGSVWGLSVFTPEAKRTRVCLEVRHFGEFLTLFCSWLAGSTNYPHLWWIKLISPQASLGCVIEEFFAEASLTLGVSPPVLPATCLWKPPHLQIWNLIGQMSVTSKQGSELTELFCKQPHQPYRACWTVMAVK